MDKKFYVDINLLGENALLSAAWIELEPATSPPTGSTVEGAIYYDNTSGSPDKEIPLFYDGSNWYPMYHFQNSTPALGTQPSSGDLFLIWDVDGGGTNNYKYVTYSELNITSGYWSRDTTGTAFLYPTTTTDAVGTLLGHYIYLNAVPASGPGSDYIGMVDSSPDYLRINSSLNMYLNVQDDGHVQFAANENLMWTMYESSAAAYLITGLGASHIGISGTPVTDIYSESYMIEDNSNVFTLTGSGSLGATYTLKVPDAAGGTSQILRTTSGDATQLEWVSYTADTPVSVDGSIDDIFDIDIAGTQVIAAVGAVTKGDIMYSDADDNWTRLAATPDGYVLAVNTDVPAWEAVFTVDGSVSNIFDVTASTRVVAGTSAKGDLVYASATNVLNKLTIGNSGEFLYVNTDVPAWGSATDLDIAKIYSEEFNNTTGAVAGDGLWVTNGSVFYYYIDFADITAACGMDFTTAGGVVIQVYQTTTYDDGLGADNVWANVDCAYTVDYTNSRVMFHASSKFAGYVVVAKGVLI